MLAASYATLAIATLVGMITPVNPIKGLLLDGGDQWHCRGAVMAMMMARPFSEYPNFLRLDRASAPRWRAPTAPNTATCRTTLRRRFQ
jgi:hypothetical protein